MVEAAFPRFDALLAESCIRKHDLDVIDKEIAEIEEWNMKEISPNHPLHDELSSRLLWYKETQSVCQGLINGAPQKRHTWGSRE